MAMRDAGNALVAELVASPAVAIDAPAMGLVSAYMRAELDMEMRHIPKPMFAEMSSGRSQSPAPSASSTSRHPDPTA